MVKMRLCLDPDLTDGEHWTIHDKPDEALVDDELDFGAGQGGVEEAQPRHQEHQVEDQRADGEDDDDLIRDAVIEVELDATAVIGRPSGR